MTNTSPLEKDEQAAVIQYLELRGHKFSAIPADTGHTPEARRRAVRMKRAGYRKGMPDLFCIVNGHAFFLEMKRVKNSTVSPEQKSWVKEINTTEIRAYIAKGSEEAIAIIEDYEGVL